MGRSIFEAFARGCLSTTSAIVASIAAAAAGCGRVADPIFFVQPARIAVVLGVVVGGQDGASGSVSVRISCAVAVLFRHGTDFVLKKVRGLSHGSIGVRLLAATVCERRKKGATRVERSWGYMGTQQISSTPRQAQEALRRAKPASQCGSLTRACGVCEAVQRCR